MLTIKNLQVEYGDKVALSVSTPIIFEEGDRIGIIGSNGAGKSTLVKSIIGLTPYKGSIQSNLRPEDISVHLQENNYADTMPIKYIIEGILNTSIKKDRKLQDLIHFFDMEKSLNKKFSALSGGQKQRMTIIMVLMQDKQLVFFDEVTSGLDFETRQQLMEKIKDWYQGKNATICMVSHYYEELEQLVNKILILDNGRVVDYGDKDYLFRKYCKNAIITIENTEKNRQLVEEFAKVAAPNHLIALSCENSDLEVAIAKLLIENNISFKRSNNDIEIMSINAKLQGNAQI